jgi:hypothetical protein
MIKSYEAKSPINQFLNMKLGKKIITQKNLKK